MAVRAAVVGRTMTGYTRLRQATPALSPFLASALINCYFGKRSLPSNSERSKNIDIFFVRQGKN